VPLHNLTTFVAVAERRSFSAAAAALAVSPSAVSQAVRALEAELGTPLLVRTTRSVRLTDAGARLYASAAPALRQAEDALAAARGGAEAGGTLRLTVPRISVPIVIAPALPLLRKQHPALSIEISVDDRLVDIVAEGFDAGIRIDDRVERDMVGVRVSPPFRFVVVASPRYLARRGTPAHPRDLVDHDCIGWRGPATGVLYRWEFERRGKALEVQVPSPIIATDADLMVRAALDGLGFCYVDELTAAPHITAGRLRVVLDDYLPRCAGFFLYFPERARTQPKLRALVEVLRAQASSR
jgi:DNA-binding transcriptional LysR family regulator